MTFTYKQNDLFTPGPITDLNARVGANGGPYNYQDYARGYFSAARKLLAQLRGDPASVDILVYPLAYLFRHGIELSLKGLTLDLSRLFDMDRLPKLSHKLDDNWKSVRSLLERLPNEFDFDGNLIPLVDKVLKDFLEFDPTGEVFRYPEDKAGNLFLQDVRSINVEVLGSILDAIGGFLDCWFHQANKLADTRHDSVGKG